MRVATLPRRARLEAHNLSTGAASSQGSWTFGSLTYRLESDNEEEELERF